MESKVFILDQTTIKKLLTIFKLVIPDFQRNFVWKKSKKQQLLASLFRGFPIGAITLYEDMNGYYIIDGLQRINTLNQYLSRPNTIISFDIFFEKAESDFRLFLKRRQLIDLSQPLEKYIKEWYVGLNSLYGFEKVSILYSVLMNGHSRIAEAFRDLELVEELLGILKSKIELAYDDIALIIYRGSKDDLPELFKNINTGSVALSQYEILQSVWNDYLLDKDLIQGTFEAFGRELELIRDDYEIEAVKEAGAFDIFKNIIGLNHMICCKEDCNILFNYAGLKKIPEPKKFGKGITKYFDNDSIAFEIYSTILCNAPNQIVKGIDAVYKHKDIEKISLFIDEINKIIMKAVDIAIEELRIRKAELQESKYHSLYIIAGIIFSHYSIDVNRLSVEKTSFNDKIYDICMDIEQHKKDKWFINENRQVGFFNIKIEDLTGMGRNEINNLEWADKRTDNFDDSYRADILRIRIGDKIITANTVKEFYYKIFHILSDYYDIGTYVPYATGRKRYLVNWTNHHINGALFVSPIKVGNYYIETHKSRMGALRDIYNFLKNIGIDVGYVE